VRVEIELRTKTPDVVFEVSVGWTTFCLKREDAQKLNACLTAMLASHPSKARKAKP
jgi:hypothetical protein